VAYVQPTAADLKARFPEFAPVADATVTALLDEATARVGESWVERDRRIAQLYLAAHLLASEGEPHRTTGGLGASVVTTGVVKRRRVGDVETEFAGATGGAGGGTAGSLATTVYGQRYLELQRLNFPAVAVV
jgi:hypothetical protein